MAPEPAGYAAELAHTVEQQAQTIHRLTMMVEAGQALLSTLDLAQLIDTILKLATGQTHADRGSCFLVDNKKEEIWSLIAQGLEERELRLPMGRGISGTVAQTGEVVNLADAYDDLRFDREVDKRSGYRTRSLLCLPIKDRDGKIVGVLQLLNKKDAPMFSADDVAFLQGISVHAAIALENAKLHRDALEKQKMERDLSLARTIQQALLPEAPPELEQFDIAVRNQTTLHVGGDYYDFIPLDKENYLIIVADVEGKGVASGLIMSNLEASLHALSRNLHSLEAILFTLNDTIVQSGRSRKFMTMFVGILNLPGRVMHYINAGHVPPALLRSSGEVEFLTEGGMVVGLFPQMRYKRGEARFQPGDVLLLCTDGITEAANAQDEQYESERMVACAKRMLTRPAKEIVDAVFAEVAEFSAEGTHKDDRVMMAIKTRL